MQQQKGKNAFNSTSIKLRVKHWLIVLIKKLKLRTKNEWSKYSCIGLVLFYSELTKIVWCFV